MPRLNITVPQELYERIDRWRDRLNLSRICQEAIARELSKLEEIPDEVRTMHEALDRLQREKAAAERSWFRRGVHDGLEWARGAEYGTLKRWGGERIMPESIQQVLSGPAKEAAGRYIDDQAWDSVRYGEGWLTGVNQFWIRVKDRI